MILFDVVTGNTLADLEEEMYRNVRSIFDERDDYALGSALVANLRLWHKFDAENIFVRLLLADHVQVLIGDFCGFDEA